MHYKESSQYLTELRGIKFYLNEKVKQNKGIMIYHGDGFFLALWVFNSGVLSFIYTECYLQKKKQKEERKNYRSHSDRLAINFVF